MRVRILTAVVGAALLVGPAASAASLEDGLTNLGACDADVQRPEVTDRDVEKKAEKADRGLIPDVHTPGVGADSEEDYRPLRGGLLSGGLLSDDEDSAGRDSAGRDSAGGDSAERDTNNLDLDGGLSILCN